MTKKRFIYYAALFCASLVALSILSLLASIAHASSNPPANQKDIEQILSLQAAVDHLIIPRIKVNAVVDPVNTNASGAMAVPANEPWEHVGWYMNGPYPGSQGSAVIDGHLDRPGGLPAVFWNLRQLQPDDSAAGSLHNIGEVVFLSQARFPRPCQGWLADSSNQAERVVNFFPGSIARKRRTYL